MKAKLDALLGKWTSRKLMVFLTGTGLAIFGQLTSSDWVIVATVYIGSQTVIDAVTKLKQ